MFEIPQNTYVMFGVRDALGLGNASGVQNCTVTNVSDANTTLDTFTLEVLPEMP